MIKKLVIAASIIAAVAAAIAVLVLMPFLTQHGQTQTQTQAQIPTYNYEVRKITINGVTLDVEIADDSKKMGRGLMFRDTLPENRGMLFVFDQERKYTFWMMNMTLDLDIIWLDTNGKVVYTVEDAKPCIDSAHTSSCTFSPDKPAKYVLEVNSGFVRKHGINENSVMRILT